MKILAKLLVAVFVLVGSSSIISNVSINKDSGFSSFIPEANAGRLGGRSGGFRGGSGINRGSFSGRSPSRSRTVTRSGSGFSGQGTINRSARQSQTGSIRYSNKPRTRTLPSDSRSVSPTKRQEQRANLTERQDNRLGERNERLDKRYDNRENAREDWQDFRHRSREDRQDFIEDRYDDLGYWRHHGWHHHHHGGFYAGLIIGATIASLPAYTHTVVYSGTTYYYSAGVYYVSEPSGYVIVSPPAGIIVEAPPADCEEVKVVDNTYCYNRGSFYSFDNDKNAYVVVPAPEGAMVSTIPDESKVKMVNGVKYHVYLDVYYRPHFYRNDYVYVVSKV